METGTVGPSAQWNGLFERSLKTTIKPTQGPAGFYFHQGEYSEQSSWEGGGGGEILLVFLNNCHDYRGGFNSVDGSFPSAHFRTYPLITLYCKWGYSGVPPLIEPTSSTHWPSSTLSVQDEVQRALESLGLESWPEHRSSPRATPYASREEQLCRTHCWHSSGEDEGAQFSFFGLVSPSDHLGFWCLKLKTLAPIARSNIFSLNMDFAPSVNS